MMKTSSPARRRPDRSLPVLRQFLPATALLFGALLGQVQAQITLPTPIVRETFDSVAEGSLPAGWSVENFTDDGTPGEDLDDPKSDSYKNWVVISRQRVEDLGTAGKWESGRRLAVAPSQILNGTVVTNLVEGNFIYAESDNRGGNQVQYLFSPDFNLSGKTNVFVFYNSIYEQNQDSMGSVEYSIDQGKTWLPIVYMIDGPDIVRKADGSIDGYATLSATNGDTAKYTDPNSGELVGSTYGSFIGVSSNLWSTLAPFISARVNDDTTESKRLELFRLPQADNQAKVRFRFAQAGTGSWYFGMDNFGLYSIAQVKPGKPTIAGPKEISFFEGITLTSSSFKATDAAQTHTTSVWQISDSPSFTADKGFANVLENRASGRSLTNLSVTLGRVVPGGQYYATVQHKDQNGGASDFAEPISFTVSSSFPTPIAFEDFESTAEGATPKGWTLENQTDGAGVGEDPTNSRSDTYLNWAVTTLENLTTFGADRVNVTNVVSGKSLYAESDTRTGNQIQFATTPDYDLTSKSNIWVVFDSNYVQNQDSFGGLEYSIDSGKTWFPVVYMIDQPDVLLGADGSVDAVKTLTTTYGDVAKMIDPATGSNVDIGKYGDFVKATPLADLGSYISGRLNDDIKESKRKERYRLTKADGQSKVRLRFTQAGTASWFWGIDNLGLYSVASAPAKTKPDAPVLAAPSNLSVLQSSLLFSGSGFSGIKPTDSNTQTVFQVSTFSTLGTNGFTNVLFSVTDTTGATQLKIPAGRLFPGQTYFATVQYQDQSGIKSDFAAPISFTITDAANPVYLETFENTADFAAPAGWTLSNQTDTATAGNNTADPKSDVYKDWLVVPTSTLTTLGGGRVDTNVVNGKSLYAESDNRGGNQIQVALSPKYDLRGRQNVWLTFKSNYVQNQDSIGVLEYSVDGGATWLPLSYLIDDKTTGGDVVRTNGVIDATATLTKTSNDIAKIIDPATSARVAAGKYADFILAQPISDLGAYISGRIDDDKVGSRTLERFRLTAADNAASVQLRFVQAGTGSWWWGIDDLAIFALDNGGAPRLSITAQGANASIAWNGTAVLQSADAVTGPWTDVPGSPKSPQTVSTSSGAKFYRLRQ